ncbi:DNA replication/repair protein RecF [Rhodohalobacter sulfatireducens]|uniref:DNA replication and repair protein RecF n=1 Tax=Rhodohalobacter sulfatireducens TaxID=2911366 RepID=A0ABS9KJM0_9BACT|nr:DNA replication/repair protein RecF [Rhodohalobacter sulfatireducens]MCG2591038.1 DNA replication/repair protein RecF [Rhodohalobacter sulfatireducens]MDR9408256.1 DNA replication/repair protein RecF [Balneolaceae bacterium]
MRINRLKLQFFRNHEETEVQFAPHLNLFTGPNGAGKTNLIDAIHYLCMTRSFVASSDQYVAHHDEKYFMIDGDFEGEIRSSFKVSCSYSRGEGKKIFVNDSPLDRLSDLIGMIPVVVLSPEDRKLTSEGPAERRSFLDSMISQISPKYLRDLIKFRKIRKQRNKLLQEYQGPLSMLKSYLEPWDVQLAQTGTAIIFKRAQVLEKFKEYLAIQYQSITGLNLEPTLRYESICDKYDSHEQIHEEYVNQIESNFEKEAEREQTIIGPHRDEVVFYLGDIELRNYGSQGQHRLFSMALKMAQLFYYSDELDDLPIMLLDDVFGNLDQQKIDVITEALTKHSGQTFITSASERPFDQEMFKGSEQNVWFTVENGTVSSKF